MRGKNGKSRHGLYKVGTCKLTCTVPNEDSVKADRAAKRRGYRDRSEFLRALIHEAVWREPLLDEDIEALKDMTDKQR